MSKNIQTKIKGVICYSCVNKVKTIYKNTNLEIEDINIDSNFQIINFRLPNDSSLDIKKLNQILKGTKYELNQDQKSKLDNFVNPYFGIILIAIVAFVAELTIRKYFHHSFQVFMAFWLILFGILKVQNLAGFDTMFRKYDLLAKNIPYYSYFFAFTELALGLLYLNDKIDHRIGYFAILIFSVTSVSVIKTILSKKKIKCACLGANSQMKVGYVTLVENLLMIVMVIKMLNGW